MVLSEEEIFFPAFRRKKLLADRFVRYIQTEHGQPGRPENVKRILCKIKNVFRK
jgi:hypothetical protein